MLGPRNPFFCALRCNASQQAKNRAGWEQLRANLHPATRSACRGPRACGARKVLAAACTARLRSPRSPSASSGSLRAKRTSHPNKPNPGLVGTPVKSCPDTCVVDRSGVRNSESKSRSFAEAENRSELLRNKDGPSTASYFAWPAWFSVAAAAATSRSRCCLN